MLKVKSIKTDGKLNDYLRKVAGIKAQVKIGFFEGAKYPDGTSVALVAYKNETGGDRNPRRPFMKRTVQNNQRRWVRGIANNLRGGRFDRGTVYRAYSLCGQVAMGDIKRTIADWDPADPRLNSYKTIRRKAERAKRAKGKNVKPIDPTRALIDTGRMIASVQYKVEM